MALIGLRVGKRNARLSKKKGRLSRGEPGERALGKKQRRTWEKVSGSKEASAKRGGGSSGRRREEKG